MEYNSVKFKKVEFPDYSDVEILNENNEKNLISDISFDIKAVIGTSDITVRELLDLSVGKSIILEKKAGSSARMIINGKCVMHGDITSVNGISGVMITDIIK